MSNTLTNNGFKNEYEFVKYLDGKIVRQLNPLFRECFDNLFEIINEEDIVKSWKNDLPQKADFFIKIGNSTKSISLKMGMKNSVHVDAISEFIHFLIENGVDKECIVEYLKYQYADGTTNGSGEIRQSVEEYKAENQGKIDKINEQLNSVTLLKNAIKRFVLVGNNSNKSIDAIIYGEINDFVWISSDDIVKIILSKRDQYSSGVHFGSLSCQPMNRCLNRNPLYEKKRYCVQIKWYNLFDEIIEFKNNQCIENE